MGSRADDHCGCTGVGSRGRSQRRARAAILAALLLAAGALIGGCATGTVADHGPATVGSLPEGTPARPGNPYSFPAVHDMPPPRDERVLTVEEQRKVEEELVAARTRAATAVGPTGKPAATASKPAATPRKPAASAEKPAAGAEKPAAGAEKPAAGTEKP
jgi:hypothetical protein